MRPEHAYPTSAQFNEVVREMHKQGLFFVDAIKEFKKQFVLTVLRDLNWNETKAARALGVHRNTIGRTIRQLGVDVRSIRKSERRPARGGVG